MSNPRLSYIRNHALFIRPVARSASSTLATAAFSEMTSNGWVHDAYLTRDGMLWKPKHGEPDPNFIDDSLQFNIATDEGLEELTRALLEVAGVDRVNLTEANVAPVKRSVASHAAEITARRQDDSIVHMRPLDVYIADGMPEHYELPNTFADAKSFNIRRHRLVIRDELDGKVGDSHPAIAFFSEMTSDGWECSGFLAPDGSLTQNAASAVYDISSREGVAKIARALFVLDGVEPVFLNEENLAGLTDYLEEEVSELRQEFTSGVSVHSRPLDVIIANVKDDLGLGSGSSFGAGL